MSPNPVLSSVELFTGAGGLALGVAAAGFKHRLLLEYNKDACKSLRENREAFGGEHCDIFEGDVRFYDFSPHVGVDLLAAGAPCQPFSIAGKHRTHSDERNLFPQVFRAQREMQPRAVMVENVKGLLRSALSEFVEFIELQLAHPTIVPKNPLDPDGWKHHLPKLRRARAGGDQSNFQYSVEECCSTRRTSEFRSDESASSSSQSARTWILNGTRRRRLTVKRRFAWPWR